MSANRSSQWSAPLTGLIVVAGAALAFVGIALLGPTHQAEAAALSERGTVGFQTTDKLVVNIGLTNSDSKSLNGTLQVEVLDPAGQSLGQLGREIRQSDASASYRFELPATKLPPEKLTLHCTFGKQELKLPLANVLVVKAHETSLSSGTEFFAGSPSAIRCEVHGVKSLSETLPLSGADVSIKLRAKDGKIYQLSDDRTGADGVAQSNFKMPDLPAGPYTLVVATKSGLGEEKLEKDVQLKAGSKILLVTDKPLYQPGQLMHIRALALRPFDLKPVAGSDLVFEVEDSKGNKVFKRTHKTSDFGVAAVDFQLADEVNMGDYHVRAVLGDQQSDKTVGVKKYVLPKFKNELKADKKYYAPKETLHAELQSDYFFGKPVANGKVKVTVSTFDVQFKDFFTWDGTTDANGHVKFDVKLPDYFVGQPLQKGDAFVRVEAKITDSADHTETASKNFTVSDQPIRVSLIPEGGRIVPEVENRVFAAAIYPDGTPAACEVQLWVGRQAKDKAVATLKTNDAGLAEFKITPKTNQLRAGPWEVRTIEMLGGQTQQTNRQKIVFDLYAEAKDKQGNAAKTAVEVNSEPLGENILIRLDKAIYKAGDSMHIETRSSAGLPTVYYDVIKSGQTMLTKWLDFKDGAGYYKLDLPADLFGTLEVHAYQMLASGEIIRDSRVVYVQPRDDLKIDIKADKAVYLPGQEGQIRFQVTDAKGKPTAAALGVIIVDEAVYALQEMQPGLEKVYFTLQEELMKPQVQAGFKPSETIDILVRDRELPAEKQQIAQVLMTAVKPKVPARWSVEPAFTRKQQAQAQVQQIGFALFQWASQNQVLEQNKETKKWSFKAETLDNLKKAGFIADAQLKDPFGNPITIDNLAQIDKNFAADRLARGITLQRMQSIQWMFIQYTNANRAKFFNGNQWGDFPDTILADAARTQGYDGNWINTWLKDAWGNQLKVMKVDKKRDHKTGNAQFDYHEIVSAGPDGKFGTDDDVKMSEDQLWHQYAWWWGELDGMQGIITRTGAMRDGAGLGMARGGRGFGGGLGGDDQLRRNRAFEMQLGAMPPMAGAPGGVGGGGGLALPMKADAMERKAAGKPGEAGDVKGVATAPITRVREYFPETMLWQPALITDDKGIALLPLSFADSITTWRLSASASSRLGGLGGVSAPLRVFQDFFVDLDLPVSLTQNDEVAFPIAVYNYLKTPQTVKLELQKEEWFDLLDDQRAAGLDPAVRSLDLQAGDVTAVKFRIRARKIGYQPLTVKAAGSKMSDAIKRVVEVVPDGTKVEKVYSDRLSERVSQRVSIPADAVPDASKILVKVYPGVFSQLLEGADGILRLPGGCFEQTSSSAYPNVLVVDYIKKAKVTSPEMLMKAENYLNIGYQRLLTFERPGGGFDWWGSGEPLVWLSAYGLQEFNDMAKVYPIDKGIINRTQAWLMKQQDKTDGTWSNIGATHGESIAAMGNPKLLLTSYVVWALVDSGLRVPELNKSIDFIRAEVKKDVSNAYILALAANALAAWDAKDDSTLETLQKLDKMRKEIPEWKAVNFSAAGQSISYSRGDYMTIEATALTALAMMKTGQFTSSVNGALMYLVKSKDASGTWGSTSATILSLKALVAGMTSNKVTGKVDFKVLVNGKEAAKGEVSEQNADVMQMFDLKAHTNVGDNDVELVVNGETNMMYQIVGRHFDPWRKDVVAQKSAFDVKVDYDRTSLSTADILRAKATMKFNGAVPTYNVILDLGIAPGFTVDAGDFAELVAAKKVEKFSVTARQVILYLGDVKPGDVRTFEYTLKPKYPVKAKTPATVAYEYYTPANRGTAKPVELTVSEKK